MRRLLAVGALALLACAGAASPAAAEAPVRTGWWTAATLGGTVAPMPTTADTDLHVASGPQGTLALAALDYHVAPVDSATLVLPITAGSVAGTPVLYACPTKDESWKAGGDQAYDTAPVPQCTGRQVQGVVTADSVTFLLDGRSQLSPGVLSLALVPAAGSTFSMDLSRPGAGSLVVVPAEQPSAPAVPTTAPAAGPPAPAAAAGGAGGAGGTGGTGTAALPSLSTGSVLPPVAPPVSDASAPLLAGPAPASPAGVPAPLTAGAPRAGVPLQAASLRRPLGPDSGKRLATVLLVALVGAAGYLLGRDEQPPLRLLGGRALRAAGVPAVDADGPVRGIGRFARTRTRTAPARGLR